MIKNLRIRNFKSWRDTGEVRLAPLTVLFGTNSSGKSSLEQFFLMLRQTVESSDRKLVLHPGDRETAVNLGSFEELVYRRDKSAKLEFSVEWDLSSQLKVTDPKTQQEWAGSQMSFECNLGMQNGKQMHLGVDRFAYRLMQGSNSILLNRSCLAGSVGISFETIKAFVWPHAP